MNQLIILKGLPGSGKSSRAKQIIEDDFNDQLRNNGIGHGAGIICSADQYFERSGTYQFDPKLLSAAHNWCKNKTYNALSLGRELVVVDNTNTQKWEYQPYLEWAEEFGYEVKIEMVGNLTDVYLYFSRNIHGVPLEVIKKMATRFQL